MIVNSARKFQSRLRLISGNSGNLLESHLSKIRVFHDVANNGVDPYDKYRAWNKDLETLLIKETKDSRLSIDEMLNIYGNGETVYSIEKSIQERSLATDHSIPQTGPSGNYIYHFEDNLSAPKRTYKRRKVMNNLDQHNAEDMEVFQINFQWEQVGATSLSVDEKYIARVVTSFATGARSIIIRDIDSGQDITMRLPSEIGSVNTVEFGPKVDCRQGQIHSIFFTSCNEAGRPNSAYISFFDGKEYSEPDLCLTDEDDAHLVEAQRTKGGEYMAISSTSKTSNEIVLVGLSSIDAEITSTRDITTTSLWHSILVKKRVSGIQYYIDCGVDGDIILMAHRFASKLDVSPDIKKSLGLELTVFETCIHDLPLEACYFGKRLDCGEGSSLFPFIEDIDLFRNHIVLYERSPVNALQQIRIIARTQKPPSPKNQVVVTGTKSNNDLQFQSLTPGSNINYNSSSISFVLETPVSQPETYRYNFKTGFIQRVSGLSADGGNLPLDEESRGHTHEGDRKRYTIKRNKVLSNDGVEVPMTLVYQEDSLNYDEKRPVLLIGYGCYGENVSLQFDPSIQLLVEKGFVVAYCHGRGGGELGKEWYEKGKMHNKGRAIEDFLACGEALKNGIRGEDGKLIKSSFLAAKAFSAGGVIVGAAVNMNPSLFDAISLTNPFLDVLNAMKDKSHYLTEHEWDEFGDPINDPRAFSSIQNYCPFHNLKSYNTRYPVMFIVGTRDDENVPYHHAVTYGMKVRGLVEDKGTSRNNAPVLLHIEQDGGHDLYGKRLQVSALETSFLLGRNGCASEHL